MRLAKIESLRKQIEVLSQSHERELDRKDAVIQMLDKDLEARARLPSPTARAPTTRTRSRTRHPPPPRPVVNTLVRPPSSPPLTSGR